MEDIIPKLIEIKKDLAEELELILFNFGLDEKSKILVVSGPTATKKIAKKILRGVKKFHIIYREVPEATPDRAVFLHETIQKKDIDVVLAVGGGTPIDTAKYAAHNARKPLYVFPTAPSHDGISSGNVSLKGWKYPYSIVATPPKALIVNYNILKNAPFDLVTAGIGDILGKYTASRDLDLAIEEQQHNKKLFENISYSELKKIKHTYFIGSAKTVSKKIDEMEEITKKKGIPPGPKHPTFPSLIKTLLKANYNSGKGMSILRSSVGASGSEHLYAHVLPKGKHGHKVALGSIIAMYLQQTILEEDNIYGMSYKELQKKFKYLKIPTTGKELGIEDKAMINALQAALNLGRRRKRFTIFEYMETFCNFSLFEYGSKVLAKLKVI